jgi:uncharacterized LabA/DUF88 family protein
MNRVCVFIDGSSFYFALKRNNHATRVDYHELSKALVGPDRQLIRTYYYNSSYDPLLSSDQWKGQQPFLESLTRTPYLESRLGKLIPLREGGFKEKGTDIRLASDLVYYAASSLYDTAVVITEEPDFAVPLGHVKELGRHVELGLFPDNQPRELIQTADRIIPLAEVIEKLGSKIFPEAQEGNDGNRVEDTRSNKHIQSGSEKVVLKPRKVGRPIGS